VRERVAVPLRLAAARLGAAVVFLAAPSVSSAFLRVRVPVPVEPLLAEAERPVPLAFSLAPEARWLVLRLAVLLVPAFVDVLFAPPSDEEEEGEPLPPSTFCAASATASAISEPKRLTLAAIELAALVALSAASAPASRILRRTDGLALIAAAAAASPAASISLLIAAFASLSKVSFRFTESSCDRPYGLEFELSAAEPLAPAPAVVDPRVSSWLVKLLLPP
jgi:hypothetical protein